MIESHRGRVTSPTLHATILVTLGLFAACLAMAFLFKVEVVARGSGRVVPVGRVQVVQSEYDARIVAINVTNGTRVERGDVLIELDDTETEVNLATNTAETDRLMIENARIAALEGILLTYRTEGAPVQTDTQLQLPEELSEHPFAGEQGALLRAEIGNVAATLEQFEARRLALSRAEAVANAQIARVTAALEIEADRLAVSQQLLDQGTTSRAAFLDVQQAYTELERQLEVLRQELTLKHAEHAAIDAETNQYFSSQHEALIDRKVIIESRLFTLREERRTLERRLESTRLIAPTGGTVDQLQSFTIGGIAQAGSEILRIVPNEAEIEVEARFSNADIGFLQVGQPTNIGLDAYPSERFGYLKGTVTDISADSEEVEPGRWQYSVRIAPDRVVLDAGGNSFPIRPGMTVTADVTTDERRLISYFFAPIVQTLQDAIGER